jgi:hypothetical protein
MRRMTFTRHPNLQTPASKAAAWSQIEIEANSVTVEGFSTVLLKTAGIPAG